jgi:hypothetical protein
VRGTSRAIVNADQFNVMQMRSYLCLVTAGVLAACASNKVSQFSIARSEAETLRATYANWRTVLHPGQGDQMRVKVGDLSDQARGVGLHGGFVVPSAVFLYTGFENNVGTGLVILTDSATPIDAANYPSFEFAQTDERGILRFSQQIGMHNQSTDPTFASGTPPAGQESRHP